ncbi:hemerythrin-like domain-containing protein [Nakamurella sp. UYEF19]|uniref:hemerythrin domain-containing protein n=1 Tax=Nakamurella sp. UYEF19 TaxID=1756392 RepID=UPI00339A9A4D
MRTTEREGNWGTAGGLPVADRPVAVPVTAPPSRVGAGNHRNLVAIHDHLREELRQIGQAAADVASGELDAGAARNLINRMTMRQNRWTLGSFCAAYCRVVTIHHTIEDTHMFPAVAASAPELGPVLHRLEAEHEVIADVLDRFDRSLVLLVQENAAGAEWASGNSVAGQPNEGTREVQRLAQELADLLLSHLRYEEDELKDGLATLTGPI